MHIQIETYMDHCKNSDNRFRQCLQHTDYATFIKQEFGQRRQL